MCCWFYTTFWKIRLLTVSIQLLFHFVCFPCVGIPHVNRLKTSLHFIFNNLLTFCLCSIFVRYSSNESRTEIPTPPNDHLTKKELKTFIDTYCNENRWLIISFPVRLQAHNVHTLHALGQGLGKGWIKQEWCCLERAHGGYYSFLFYEEETLAPF